MEWKVFGGLGAFTLVFAIIYVIAADERAGQLLLVLMSVALIALGGWMWLQGRRAGLRPEDRPDADLAEGTGEVGEFPARSPWPVTLGLGATFVAYGLAFSIWLALPGFALLILGAAGFVFEARPD